MGYCGMRMTFTEKRFFDQLDLLERATCLQYTLKIWDVNTDKPLQLTHQIKCATFTLSNNSNNLIMTGNQK